MIFRSKKYPWADIVITFVSYNRLANSSYIFNEFSIIGWERVNEVEFDKYVCKKKGYEYLPNENGLMDFSDKSTFPYPFFGEQKPRSMDNYIKKYELEFVEMSDKEVTIYANDIEEYSSDFKL